MRSFKLRVLCSLLGAALTLSLAACGTSPSGSAPTAQPDPFASAGADPSPAQKTDAPESSASVPPSAQPSPESTPSPEPEYEPYVFGTPLEEGEAVEDSYFDDAVFLGDSRTEGLQLFGGLAHGDYYWARGMTVFQADDPKYAVFTVDGGQYTMLGALARKRYKAVYIMIGVNELGYPVSSYEEGLGKLVDRVLELQPEAVVYLQIMPPINDTMARENGLADYINNGNLAAFNEAVVRTAAEKRVVLLDTAAVYRDEDGQLLADVASDGCHFTRGGYARWVDYLRCHVMDAQRYFYDRTLTEEADET